LWIAYAATVAWALVAIVVQQAGSSSLGVIAAIAGAIPAAAAVFVPKNDARATSTPAPRR
ncbi:MAG: hypothetical protein ACR2J8_05775, partial [Thermomicrobiales bacterium]